MAYRDVVLADSPVSYWRLGESAGSTAADEQSAHAGTYTGTITKGVTGPLVGDSNTAITMAASGSAGNYISLAAAKLLGGQTNWTIECWVKSTGTRGVIYCERATTGADILRWEIAGTNPSNPPVMFYRDDANVLDTVNATNPARDGAWHHLVVTKSGTTVTHYKDGVTNGSATLSSGNTFTNASIDTRCGVDRTNGLLDFAGSLDELAIYTTALSAGRVAAHYAAGTTSIVTGAAAIAGTGTIAASGTRKTFALASVVGSGVVSASGTRKTFSAASVAGAGSIAGSGTRKTFATATVAGTGTLSASGTRSTFATASVAGTGSITAAGVRITFGIGAIAGTGTVAATGVRSALGSASIAGTGSLSATGSRTAVASATISGGGVVSATGTRTTFAVASVGGSGAISATGLGGRRDWTYNQAGGATYGGTATFSYGPPGGATYGGTATFSYDHDEDWTYEPVTG